VALTELAILLGKLPLTARRVGRPLARLVVGNELSRLDDSPARARRLLALLRHESLLGSTELHESGQGVVAQEAPMHPLRKGFVESPKTCSSAAARRNCVADYRVAVRDSRLRCDVMGSIAKTTDVMYDQYPISARVGAVIWITLPGVHCPDRHLQCLQHELGAQMCLCPIAQTNLPRSSGG
jgi:hypothetical protein